MIKKTFKIDGMHCTSCALMIESDLEDAGVKANCHYAKQTLTVEYDEASINDKKIKGIIVKSGYRVAD